MSIVRPKGSKNTVVFMIAVSFMIFWSCAVRPIERSSHRMSIVDLGAQPNDGRLDDQALVSLQRLGEEGRLTDVFFPSGTYEFSRKIILDRFKNDIKIHGEKGTKIILHNTDFLSLHFESEEMLLGGQVRMGDSSVLLEGVIPYMGGWLHLASDQVFENAWGYRENDVVGVKKVKGKKAILEHSVLFNYAPEKENVLLRHYQGYSIQVENINFLIKSDTKQQRTVASIRGGRVHIENCAFSCETGDMFHRGASLAACLDVKIEKTKFENLEYGILLNFCRGIRARDLFARHCRHALAPSCATIDVDIESLEGEGCQGVLDAHVAFGVSARKVVDKNARQFSNCRAIGVHICQSTFDVVDDFCQDYAYWSVQSLTEEYQDYYQQSVIQFDSVQWIHSCPTYFNGLTAFYCKKLIVRNCTTHNVSLYGRAYEGVVIENSRIGTLRANTHEVFLKNVKMDGSLYPGSDYVFRFSGAGETKMMNTTVSNYQPGAVLFDLFYNSPSANKVTFQSCTLQDLAFTNKMIYPNVAYSNIKFLDTKIPPRISESSVVKQDK